MNPPVKKKSQAVQRPRSKVQGRRRIIFVTGTDTGVGKTIFTGLFVYHLRRALAFTRSP